MRAPRPCRCRRRGGVDLRGLRVAAAFGEGEWQPSPRVAAAVERAADVLVAAGAQRVPWEFAWLAPAWEVTQRYWARAGYQAGLTGADVMRELEDWDRFAYRYLEATADIDLVVAPATAGPAPPHGEIGGTAFAFLLPASLVGVPALALPAGDDDTGCRSASSSSAGRGRSTCCSPPLGPSNAPDRPDRPRRFSDGKRAAAAGRAGYPPQADWHDDSPCPRPGPPCWMCVPVRRDRRAGCDDAGGRG